MDYTEEEVDEVFEEAVTLISSSKLPLSNDDMLLLYGYYKQANEGKCNTIRPGMLDFKGKAKWYVPFMSERGETLMLTMMWLTLPSFASTKKGCVEQAWRNVESGRNEAVL